MTGHDIVVVGASMGGVDVLTRLVRGLPPGLPASFFIVCHFPPGSQSVLPVILSRSGPLLAVHAADGEAFNPGQIYVARPDQHLLLRPDGRMKLTRGPRENHHRPAVDPLFRSAASAYGARVIGIVLTGSLDDGAAGLLAVRNAGGIAVVQDPADAVMASMPESATRIAGADHVVRIEDMAALLMRLVVQPTRSKGGSPMVDPLENLPHVVDADMQEQIHNQRRGRISMFRCPECGGALWQVNETELMRFRCHVGHAYHAETLFSEQSQALEAALWTAVRTFKERHLLARQLAEQNRGQGNADSAARFEEQAEQAQRYGELIQQYVLNGVPLPRQTETKGG